MSHVTLAAEVAPLEGLELDPRTGGICSYNYTLKGTERSIVQLLSRRHPCYTRYSLAVRESRTDLQVIARLAQRAHEVHALRRIALLALQAAPQRRRQALGARVGLRRHLAEGTLCSRTRRS